MSWLFSRALVEEFSGASSSGGEPSAPLKLMPSPHPFLRDVKTTDASTFSRYGLTCEVLTAAHGEDVLTSFLAGFPVRTSASEAMEQASRESDQDCGPRRQESFARWDQGMCCWRIPQRSLLGDLIEFSEIWPRWGSMRNGACFRDRNSVPQLKGSEFLLPAPTKSMGTRSRGWGISRTGRLRNSEERTRNALSFGYKPPLEILEWSLGWPITWSAAKPLETDKFREWLRSHGEF